MQRDILNQLQLAKAINQAVSSNGDIFSGGVDTKDFESGFTAYLFLLGVTDGDYQLFLQESDDNGVSDAWTDIDEDKYVNGSQPAESADTLIFLQATGCFSTKRYVRIRLNASNVTTGAAFVGVFVQRKGESVPVEQ